MAVIINTFVGDTAPVIQFTLVRANGTVPPIAGSTIKFRILDQTTGQLTNNSSNACTIVDASTGLIEYDWTLAGTDLPDEGTYDANIQITYPSGRVETADVTINVSGTVDQEVT